MLNIVCYVMLFIHAMIYASLAMINIFSDVSVLMLYAFIFYVVTIFILILSLNKSNKFKRLSAFLLIVSHAFMYLCFDPINGSAYLLYAIYWFVIFLRLQKQELILFKKYQWLYKLWPILTIGLMAILSQSIMSAAVLLGFETIPVIIKAKNLLDN